MRLGQVEPANNPFELKAEKVDPNLGRDRVAEPITFPRPVLSDRCGVCCRGGHNRSRGLDVSCAAARFDPCLDLGLAVGNPLLTKQDRGGKFPLPPEPINRGLAQSDASADLFRKKQAVERSMLPLDLLR